VTGSAATSISVVPGSEGSTFVVLDNHYPKDAKRVFYSELEPAPKELHERTYDR
jgi:hypothetical protein